MTIHHNGHAESGARFFDKLRQTGMVRPVEACQPLLGVVRLQFLAIDFGAVAYDPRDDAKAGGDAGARRCHVEPQFGIEHRVVQFGGRPIGVDISARKHGGDQRCTQAHRACEQFFDKGVFRATQGEGR